MPLDSQENHSELQHKQKFGGFPLSVVDARARQLNPLSIDSAVVLISEQSQLARKFKLNDFPCTKNEWYKYIFWPVHANGGDQQYFDECLTKVNTSPYAKLATTMRTPQLYGSTYQRGSTVHRRSTNMKESWSLTQQQELVRLLNRLELRQPPRVRLRLQPASLSAYQRAITPKLKPQCQSSTVPQRRQRQLSLRSSPFRHCLRTNNKAKQRKTHAPYAQVFARGATVVTLRPRRHSTTSSRRSCVIR